MTFKVDDLVTIDGTPFVVTAAETHGWWLKEENNGTYYYMRYLGSQEAHDLFTDGRLTYGRKKELYNDNNNCYHDWKRYVGMTEVYDYCKCGAKKFPHWTEIGDGEKRD